MLPAEKADKVLTTLFSSLPWLAGVTAGCVGVADESGNVLRIVDEEENTNGR